MIDKERLLTMAFPFSLFATQFFILIALGNITLSLRRGMPLVNNSFNNETR